VLGGLLNRLGAPARASRPAALPQLPGKLGAEIL